MIINNVKLVLEDEVVNGSLEVHDGRISAFAENQSRLAEAVDGEGDRPACSRFSDRTPR